MRFGCGEWWELHMITALEIELILQIGEYVMKL